MRITANIDALQKSLEEYKKIALRKLEGMVSIFVYKITWQAIENTPYGDSEAYSALYNKKARTRYIPAEAGFAKGGWAIEMDKPFSSNYFMQATSENAENVKWAADQRSLNYKLGDTVYISNNVPYVANNAWPYPNYRNGDPVRSLESGASSQAPEGIMQPTIDQISGIYQLKLNEYYEAS